MKVGICEMNEHELIIHQLPFIGARCKMSTVKLIARPSRSFFTDNMSFHLLLSFACSGLFSTVHADMSAPTFYFSKLDIILLIICISLW